MNHMYYAICELCNSLNMSVAKLCEQVGIAKSAMSELKAGRTKELSEKSIEKICEFTSLPAAYFYGTGVFKNFDKIVMHADDVLAELQREVSYKIQPNTAEDYFICNYVNNRDYNGGNMAMFAIWLYETTDRVDIECANGTLRVQYFFNVKFRRMLRRAKDSVCAELSDEKENAQTAELINVFGTLSMANKHRLIGYAYTLKEGQEKSGINQTISPPEVDLDALGVRDRQIKK